MNSWIFLLSLPFLFSSEILSYANAFIHPHPHPHPHPPNNNNNKSHRNKQSFLHASLKVSSSSNNDKNNHDQIITKKKQSSRSPPQILQFQEPKTNTTVLLIGTMHYNPTSIQIVRDTIQSLGEDNTLGSVLVESCDVRWNTTMDLLETPRGKFFAPVLTSEMKVASDEARRFGRPCVLGDQRINATGTSLGNTLRQTIVDAASPLNGGWVRLYQELSQAISIALPSGEGYLSANSILDPRLLIAAPVSFAKYPFSFLARNPITTSIVFAILGFLTYLDATETGGGVSFMDMTLQEQILNIFVNFLFLGVEFLLFGRLLIQVLLAERNTILAKNILGQCKIYRYSSPSSRDSSSNIEQDVLGLSAVLSFFGRKTNNSDSTSTSGSQVTIPSDDYDAPFYVPGSNSEDGFDNSNSDGDKVVVAVLGMAHCNGILKLLKEELV